MPQITLKRDQLDEFALFLRNHDVEKWFIAKDHGAYIGATNKEKGDKFKNKLFYFSGCNPDTDEDFYDNAIDKFGGDDFGEFFDSDVVHKICGDPRAKNMVVIVGKTSISIKSNQTKVSS
tara:strand:- start:334 stop:693 length:360 start_codon:yes stop_codon:yes gene_type:complete